MTRPLGTGPRQAETPPAFHEPNTERIFPLRRMNWIAQPRLLVEVAPPAFVHLSVPIERLGSMNAPRAWLLTIAARSAARAP